MRKIYRHSLKFDSEYVTRWGSYDIMNGFYHVRAAVNNGGSVFPQTRLIIGYVPEVVIPYSYVAQPIAAFSEIDGLRNRMANAIIDANGRVIVENNFYSDVKELLIDILYPNTNVITVSP